MSLIAFLVLLAELVALVAVERATANDTKVTAAVWRTAVWVPGALALLLLWRQQGASMWPFFALCLVQPVFVRGRLLKWFGETAPKAPVGADQVR